MFNKRPIEKFMQLDKGIYCLAGICKNAGKTSLLNTLLSKNKDKPLGVLTTGRDGEDKDVVFGNTKPSVLLPANTLFTTGSNVLDELGSAINVIDKLPFLAGKTQLWLVRSNRGIATEIAGPASSEAQVKIAQLMQEQKAEIVLIDGSLDRKSVAARPEIAGVFLVAGSSYGSIDKIVAELTRLIALSQITLYKANDLSICSCSVYAYQKDRWVDTGFASLLGNETEFISYLSEHYPDKLYLPYAITDAVVNSMKQTLHKSIDLIVSHPLQLHISKTNLEYLHNQHQLFTLNAFRLKGIAVNSWAVDGHHLDSSILREKARSLSKNLPVFDIYEGC